MARTVAVLLLLLCHFDISTQACNECECCDGDNACDTDKKCINGCIAGYWGDKCTESCRANCKTCVSDTDCTECLPGYYSAQCAFQCGKGCVNNTCLQSGQCTCKSSDFKEGYCSSCSSSKYGDECNYTCPNNCGSCESQRECRWCNSNAFYGPVCQFMCSIGCDKGTCNTNGRCNSGCKPDFTGEKCNSCVSGKHGSKCHLYCLSNCVSCVSNSRCTECKLGFYGETCTDKCSSGCYGICLQTNGQCMECKQGFYGDFCNNTKTCKDGFYGKYCSKSCTNVDNYCQKCLTNESGMYGGCMNCNSAYYLTAVFGGTYSFCTACPDDCKNNVCNATGFCTYGCLLGKWGGKCKSYCKSNCLECSQSNGKCIKCNNGRYSEDCSKLCTSNCSSIDSEQICEFHTGQCINGCSSYRQYGDYCEHQCSATCINQTCNWKTGHCSNGCVENYYGLFCGNKCASTCTSVERKRSCNESTGHCVSGCVGGFHGNMCESTCSDKCANNTCHQVTAECLYGCIDGYDGLQCTQATRHVQQEGISSGVLARIVFGSLLIGILIGGALTVAFIIWKRRNTRKRDEINQQTDVTYENNIPATYEDLKERDESIYSQIASNRQLSTQAAENVNC